MTAKRFTQKEEDDWEILENGKHFAYAHSGYQAKKIIETLNELSDKLDCHILLTDQERQKVSNFIKGIEKENEQLKEDVVDLTNALFSSREVNEQLKKQIEEYTNPDKYILIKKTESSTEEYNSCQDCQHYEREYEEVIAFGEYETLTKEICNNGHDIEDTDANKCNDYEYNEFWG